MEKRRLGRTDLEVTPIGLGCWQFSRGAGPAGAMVWADIGQDAITSVVDAALRGGVSWFDTAEAYGNGASEKSLAAALSVLGVAAGTVGIATKWWPLLRPASSIGRTIGDRIAALSPYPVDLHQVHQPFSVSSVPAQMREMAKLVREKRIRAIGVSNFSAVKMEQAHAALAAEGIPLASNQVRFSLLDRSIESNGILETARRLGVTIIAWSPLAQGILTGRFHEEPGLLKGIRPGRRMMSGLSARMLARTAGLVSLLREVAQAHGATIAQVALAWTVSFHGKAVVAIPGASRPGQATDAAGAMRLALSEMELTALGDASRAALHR